MYRVLSNGGVLFAMAPVIEGWDRTYENAAVRDPRSRELHFGLYDHVRYYGRDIRNRICGAGFELSEYTAEGEAVIKYGLGRGEKVFVCKKPASAGEICS
jgi:hypothetical protein